jgi:hypothetical protein
MPSSSTVPRSGCNKPVIKRTVVVLPAPFGPRSPNTTPSGIVSDIPSTTARPLNALVTPSSVSMPQAPVGAAPTLGACSFSLVGGLVSA